MGPTTKKYRKSWESMRDLKEWLLHVERDNSKALCMFCKSELLAKLSNLKEHAHSQKHAY